MAGGRTASWSRGVRQEAFEGDGCVESTAQVWRRAIAVQRYRGCCSRAAGRPSRHAQDRCRARERAAGADGVRPRAAIGAAVSGRVLRRRYAAPARAADMPHRHHRAGQGGQEHLHQRSRAQTGSAPDRRQSVDDGGHAPPLRARRRTTQRVRRVHLLRYQRMGAPGAGRRAHARADATAGAGFRGRAAAQAPGRHAPPLRAAARRPRSASCSARSMRSQRCRPRFSSDTSAPASLAPQADHKGIYSDVVKAADLYFRGDDFGFPPPSSIRLEPTIRFWSGTRSPGVRWRAPTSTSSC